MIGHLTRCRTGLNRRFGESGERGREKEALIGSMALVSDLGNRGKDGEGNLRRR
jgi:hypothetical protein